MNTLKKICEMKMTEINTLKKENIKFKRKTEIRDFFKNFNNEDSKKFNIITKIKKASPSKGLICKNFDPEFIGIQYEKAGAKLYICFNRKKFF